MPQKLISGSIKKPVVKPRKITRTQVLKVLKATMDKQQEQSTSEVAVNPKEIESEFYTTGRIGRRNALPDILAEHCKTSTADLPENFSALTTQENTPQSSASSEPGPSAPENEVSSNKT